MNIFVLAGVLLALDPAVCSQDAINDRASRAEILAASISEIDQRSDAMMRDLDLAMFPENSTEICQARTNGGSEAERQCLANSEVALWVERRAIFGRWLGAGWNAEPTLKDRDAWLMRGMEGILEARRKLAEGALPDIAISLELLTLNGRCLEERIATQSEIVRQGAVSALRELEGSPDLTPELKDMFETLAGGSAASGVPKR